MAKLPAGILSPPSGKIGSVVGASWKGINYIREYVIPGNPNTAAQQATRTLFRDLVFLAKAILGNVIQTYWDPFLKSNSGWAHFIGINRFLYTTADDYSSVHLAEGNLEGVVLSAAAYASSDVNVTWSSTVLGNGASTDKVILVVYDSANKVAFVDSSYTRADAVGAINVGSGRTAANLHCWAFLCQPATSPTMVSYSAFHAVT